jgi:predicted membrane protein
MNILQVGLVIRSGVSALVVAFLLGYSAHYEWGLSPAAIRTGALLAALLIGTLVAIEFFGRNFRKPK